MLAQRRNSRSTIRRVLVRATAALRRSPERTVLVNGDLAVAYGRVVQAMVLLQQAGARKVGFETDPPPAKTQLAMSEAPQRSLLVGAAVGPDPRGDRRGC